MQSQGVMESLSTIRQRLAHKAARSKSNIQWCMVEYWETHELTQQVYANTTPKAINPKQRNQMCIQTNINTTSGLDGGWAEHEQTDPLLPFTMQAQTPWACCASCPISCAWLGARLEVQALHMLCMQP